ncbi:DNA polymerase I [soil metagenome]
MPDTKLVTAPLGPGDHIFLVDGSSFVYRAFFQSINQDPKYNYRSDGMPIGALRLFCSKLYQFLLEGAVGIRPTHLAIIFDKTEETFRKQVYADYKANRREMPDELKPQFPLMRDAVKAFGLVPVDKAGYEADDIIATYAKEARAAGADVLIISSDKDLMQLVSDTVQFYDFESGTRGKPGYRPERRIDRQGVIEYFGVPPEKVIDVQALVGDTSDNVPGVPGIGIKTASQLIVEYGDLDTLLARADDIKQPKRRELIMSYADQARMSRELVTLHDDVEAVVSLAATRVGELDAAKLIAFTKAIELSTLTKRVCEATGIDPNTVEADPALRSKKLHDATFAGRLTPAPKPATAPTLFDDAAAPAVATLAAEAAAPPVPAFHPADRVAQGTKAATIPFDRAKYERVTTLAALDAWLDEARAAGQVAIDVRSSSFDPMRGEFCGISLATRPGRACYVPIAHRAGTSDLLGEGLSPEQVPAKEALKRIKALLEDASVLKVGQNLKADAVVLARHDITVAPYDDTMLIAYALDGGSGGYDTNNLAERVLGYSPIAFKDVIGSGKAQLTFDRVATDRATEYSAEDTDIALRLWTALKPRLVAERMDNVYETLERPLLPVLARMETRGIKVDRQILSRLSGEFSQKLGGLEHDIFELAGQEFNIGSPKQLGDILFGKFGLDGGKKTKTGAWSTGADILDELAANGNTLASRILDWRQLSKLKSTYTDLLPGFIHPETGRVHTSYALASTTTGRLSSSDPNLQNIPIRTEEGRRIRTAFIAAPGMKLISADYSQIELRIVAHVADIPQLKQAFADGHDIHAMTASEMFGVPVKGMPAEVRRRAKAINFGIIYGISAFGLANQLGIPRQEAGDYINKYFERFPGIRDYMEAMRRKVRVDGHVSTLFGRKIHFPAANSKNPAERAFVDRAAINAPIQGTAADIIRRAMIRMEPALKAARLQAGMLLQVHDELVFEAPESEVAKTLPVVTKVMEAAAEPVLQLSVPLQVDAKSGSNWDAAH